MDKIHIVLFIALFSNALGFRLKRQSDDASPDKDLEDRYGWNGQQQFPPWMNTNYPYPPYPYPYPYPYPDPNGFRNPNPNRLPNTDFNGLPNPNPTRFPNPNTSPNPTSPPTQAPNGSTTQSSSIQACIRSCLVTSEYNPVCGSNGRTYDNPGRLICAQMCGEPVTQLRAQRCPATTPAPTTS